MSFYSLQQCLRGAASYLAAICKLDHNTVVTRFMNLYSYSVLYYTYLERALFISLV